MMDDLISRQVAIDAHCELCPVQEKCARMDLCPDVEVFKLLPSAQPEVLAHGEGELSAQPEPLTDKEQRIFLAAMGREEKVCEEVDRNYVREPYEDSLMSVCREIKRKVKGALWT